MRKISKPWTKRAFAGPTHFRLAVAGLALIAGLALPAHAQNDRMTPIATPSQPNAIELGTGPLPGATNPEAWHSQYGSQFARNVTIATRGKYVTGDLLTRQVTECFGFQPDGAYSMRHVSVGHDEPLRAELLAFIEAVRSGKPPAVTGEEGVASLEIATRCLESRPAVTPGAPLKGPRRVAG